MIFNSMQDLRKFISFVLKESSAIPHVLNDKTDTEFAIGPKGEEYLESLGFGTRPIHRVRVNGKTEIKSDVGLLTFKLNTLDLSAFNAYDQYFKKYASAELPASLLKAMALEETTLGKDTSSNASTAEGVLQVVGGTLDYLNTKRKWLGKPPYSASNLMNSPEMSIKIAAEYIKNHMLAPRKMLSGDRNVGGFDYTTDEMLARYKTGDDGPRYAERVKVYKKFIDDLGAV